MTNDFTMTNDDWDEFERSARGEPPPRKLQPNPGAVQAPEPAPPVEHPSAEVPVRIRTADEIVAEHLARTPEAPEVPSLFDVPPLSIKNGVMGDPPKRAQHLTTARTEIVEVRQELAELTKLVREIHERIVGAK